MSLVRVIAVPFFACLLTLFPSYYNSSALAIECYQCHGTKINDTSGDYRPVDDSARNIQTGGFQGSHRKHMDVSATPSTCAICHPGSDSYETDHRNGIISVSMDAFYPAAYKNGLTQFPQTSTPQLGSCTNVFCHSDGTYVMTGVVSAPSTPVWGSSGNSCTACHGYPPLYANGTPKRNSHQKHPFTCNRCHYATTTDGTTITASYYHRDEGYEVSGPPGESFSYGGICYNTYCHGNGTNVTTGTSANSNTSPVWGGSGPLPCTSCHAYPPAYAKGSPKSNTHLLHNAYGYKCSQCHYATTQNGTTIAVGSTTHANHAYDVSGPPDRLLSYTFSSTGGTCDNSYCHSSVQGAANPVSPPVYASPTWNQKRTVRCRMCHKAGYHAYDSFLMDTGSHKKHLQFDSTLHTCRMCHYTDKYGSAGSCYECHNSGTTQIGSGIYTDFTPRGPEHADGVINVAFHPGFPAAGAAGSYSGDTVPGTPFGSCANLYCHSQGTRITVPYATGNISVVTWGAGALPTDCSGCHGGDINSAIPITTKSHARHLGQDCAKCHSITAANSRTALPNRPLSDMYQMYSKGSYHANGYVEVCFNNTTTAINGKYAGQTTTINRLPGAAPGRCTNVYCHTSGATLVTGGSFGNVSTPLWGTSGRLGCGSCHGNPPAYQDGYPKANAHAKHTGDCSRCHYLTTANNSSINDRSKHAQHRYVVNPAPGTSFNYAFASNGSSCNSVSCHSNGGSSRDWGTSCIHCHGNPPTPGGHQRSHLSYGCQNCHYSVTSNGNLITNPALHNNGRKTIAAGPGVSFTNLSTATFYCSNVSCHSDGTKVATGQLQGSGYGTSWWNATATLSCYGCHRDRSYWGVYDYPNGSPKANSHRKHCETNRIGCYVCHYATIDSGGNILAAHKNGQYDLKPFHSMVNFTYTYATNTDHSLGGTCANIYCHSNGTSVITGSAVTASSTWGGASLACNSCHGYPPSYPNGSPKTNGHMGKHLPYSCDKCHYGFPSGHTDGLYNVYAGTYIKLTYTRAYYSTCSNVSCHGDGTSTTTWAAPVNGPLQWGATQTFTCTSCHGMPPSYPDLTPKANAHESHTAYGCQVCHFNITTDGATITDKSRHANGYYNISSNGSAPFRFTFGYKGSSCSNISCHADGAKQRNWTYQPLGLQSAYPCENCTDIAVANPVQLVFWEPMDMSTVNGSSFYLKQGDTPVAGSYSYVNYGENNYVVSFIPNQPLQYFTTYTVTFTSDIKAATGVNISSGKTWSFKTGHSPQYGAVLNQSFPSPFDLTPFTVAKGSWIPDYYASKPYMNGVWATSAETSVVESVLQTPQLNLSSYKTLMLQFAYNLKYTAPNAAYIEVSTNGSSGPWTTVWSRTDPLAAGSTEGNYSETVDLTSLLRYQPAVMIRFRFNVTQVPQSSQGAFSVDDIYLYADPN